MAGSDGRYGRLSSCNSCGAPIRWTYTEKQKRMPVDPEPSSIGNIVLRVRFRGQPPLAEVYKDHVTALAAVDGGDTYTSHFATCPDAARHRR